MKYVRHMIVWMILVWSTYAFWVIVLKDLFR